MMLIKKSVKIIALLIIIIPARYYCKQILYGGGMADFSPPEYARRILLRLNAEGYSAYLVGGCVRDMLLGRRPHDWDICTSALPEETMAVFPHSRPTGIKHGTVSVIVNHRTVEVTTFRTEGKYADHRRPESVSFVRNLELDLSRRDFTMNAIAMSADGVLYDPFNGKSDIAAGLIRCVGEPERRFEEDALRMLRALRFSAKLGFEIEENTLAAIKRLAPLCAELAAERVREEIEQLLLNRSPETVFTLMQLGLLDAYITKRPDDSSGFERISALPKRAAERWCALCMLLLREKAIASSAEFLTSLRLDSRTITLGDDCEKLSRSPLPRSVPEIKRLLRDYGEDSLLCCTRCRDALFGGSSYRAVKKVISAGECYSLRCLAIGGRELTAIGYRGRATGAELARLLDHVIDHPEDNRREILSAIAAEDIRGNQNG